MYLYSVPTSVTVSNKFAVNQSVMLNVFTLRLIAASLNKLTKYVVHV